MVKPFIKQQKKTSKNWVLLHLTPPLLKKGAWTDEKSKIQRKINSDVTSRRSWPQCATTICVATRRRKSYGKGVSNVYFDTYILRPTEFSILLSHWKLHISPPTAHLLYRRTMFWNNFWLGILISKTLQFPRNVLSCHSMGLMQNRKCMKNEILLQKECNIMLPSLTSSISKNGLTIQFIPPALIIFQLPTLSSCTSFCKRSLVLLA